MDAGLPELSVLDKIVIAVTPDPEDLFSDDGLRQVSGIGKEQTAYYMENLDFFAEQLIESIWDRKKIRAIVNDYYTKHKKYFDDMMKKNPHSWSNPQHKIIGIIGNFLNQRFIW